MDTITAIEPQKRRGNRRSISVNGEFFAGVDEEVVFDLRLKVGQPVDAERLAQVLQTEEIRRARESALTLLDYRARTSREIEQRLALKGYPEETIAAVITQLERLDLVNDERFASDWVASRLNYKPQGRTRIGWELKRKGVSPDIVDEALAQVDEVAEFDMALELAERKLGGARIEDQDARRKLAGLLQRRGFRWDIVSRVLDKLGSEEDD